MDYSGLPSYSDTKPIRLAIRYIWIFGLVSGTILSGCTVPPTRYTVDPQFKVDTSIPDNVPQYTKGCNYGRIGLRTVETSYTWSDDTRKLGRYTSDHLSSTQITPRWGCRN